MCACLDARSALQPLALTLAGDRHLAEHERAQAGVRPDRPREPGACRSPAPCSPLGPVSASAVTNTPAGPSSGRPTALPAAPSHTHRSTAGDYAAHPAKRLRVQQR
eukprot:scaffold83825_cov28-Phaeocystis_antarctica.AAC.1